MIATTEPNTIVRLPLGARPQLACFNMSEFEKNPTRIQKIIHARKSNTAARNERIRKRFNFLYHEERKRIDDVMLILCEEFSLAESTIDSALKS